MKIPPNIKCKIVIIRARVLGTSKIRPKLYNRLDKYKLYKKQILFISVPDCFKY